jgi:hypothetical protein
VTLTAAAYSFSLLFSWYFQPFIAKGKTSRFPMQLFGNMGVSFAAWTLLAFAMAAFAGALIRRTVPAMAATLTVWTVLDVTTMMALRQHYEAPATTTGTPASGALLLSQWYTGPNGKPVSQATMTNVMQQAPASVRQSVNQAGDPAAMQSWLSKQHYTQWFSYDPASRFWHFQLIEGTWLLALSLILLTATIYLVRRRAA